MLSAGIFAVEFCFVVEVEYGVPVMLKTGLPRSVATAMWSVGPVLGILFQGYLGSASDKCTSRWGRRRPFIVAIGVLMFIGALCFPYGRLIALPLSLGESGSRIFVMVFTAGTLVILDFALDAQQSPMRAYLLDSLPADKLEFGNYIFSAVLSLGSLAGAVMSAFPWKKYFQDRFEYQIEVVFGISVAFLILCLSLTVFSVKEKQQPTSDLKLKSGVSNCCISKSNTSFLSELSSDICDTYLFAKHMSSAFFNLWLLTFFTYLSFNTLYLFFTDFVGSVVYGGQANTDDKMLRDAYDEGVLTGCIGNAVLSLFEFLSALTLGYVTQLFGVRLVYFVTQFMFLGAIGFVLFFPSVFSAMLVCAAAGIHMALNCVILFSLVPQYQEAGLLLRQSWPSAGQDEDCKGKAVSFLFMGIFLAQFVLGLLNGSLVRLFSSSRVVMVVSFTAELLATATLFRVQLVVKKA